MTTAPVPGWKHRMAALLLAVLAGGALYLLLDQSLLARYRFYRDRLEQQQGLLERLQRVAASREPIQQLIGAIQQDRNVVGQYLPQSAPALAAADLQQKVKTVIEAAGGTLQSTQALPAVDEGGVVRVTISVAMNGETDSLRRVLHALETQTPLLFVDNLQVFARENRPRLASGRFADYVRMQLNVQFDVSGYLRKEGG
jgi:general secretion pathway protein M